MKKRKTIRELEAEYESDMYILEDEEDVPECLGWVEAN